MGEVSPVALPSHCWFGKTHQEKEIRKDDTLDDPELPRLLGIVCQNCWREWLLPRYVQKPVQGEQVHRNGLVFFRRHGRRRQMVVHSCFSAHTSRQEIDPEQAMELLEPGDHIMWRRTYVLWHHAIVLNVSGFYINIIHWSVDNNKVIVHNTVTNSLEESGTMYKVIYSQKILDANPTSLVLARARALLDTTGYSALDRHCENLANYCKTGINSNLQLRWMVMKVFIQEMTALLRVGKVAPDIILIHQVFGSPSLYQQLMQFVKMGVIGNSVTLAKVSSVLLKCTGQAIGAGLVVLVEGAFCFWDLNTMVSNYQTQKAPEDGRSLARNDLVLEATIRSSEAFFGALGTIGGAIGFEILIGASIGSLCGPAGTATGVAIGVVVGCLIGGMAGGVVGRCGGNVVGNFVGRAIVATFKSNDLVVAFDDIEPGDHLVFYKKLTHPRCHSIVVKVHRPEDDPEEGYIEVIRNTFSRGVVRTKIAKAAFDRPVYRVTYKRKILTYSNPEIVERALAAYDAQTAKYNIFTSNCKHFCYKIVIRSTRVTSVRRR